MARTRRGGAAGGAACHAMEAGETGRHAAAAACTPLPQCAAHAPTHGHPPLPIQLVLLLLGNVMGHVVDLPGAVPVALMV